MRVGMKWKTARLQIWVNWGDVVGLYVGIGVVRKKTGMSHEFPGLGDWEGDAVTCQLREYRRKM